MRAERAYQASAVRTRPLQGRSPSGREADTPADPIIVHPDVRRMLLTRRRPSRPGALLACWRVARSTRETDADRTMRAAGGRLVGFLTPIVKAT